MRENKQDDFVKKFSHTVLSHAQNLELFYEVFIEGCIS